MIGMYASETKARRVDRAFSLIELTVVIIIIGILAAIAIPMFPRAMEATKAKEAVAALQQIRTGERVYRVEENTYWPVGSTESNIDIINEILRVFLDTRDNRNWNYSVNATDADNFTGRAIRTGGMYDTGEIVIDQGGGITAVNPWPESLLPGQ